MQQATEDREVVVQPNSLHFISLAWIARGECMQGSQNLSKPPGTFANRDAVT